MDKKWDYKDDEYERWEKDWKKLLEKKESKKPVKILVRVLDVFIVLAIFGILVFR